MPVPSVLCMPICAVPVPYVLCMSSVLCLSCLCCACPGPACAVHVLSVLFLSCAWPVLCLSRNSLYIKGKDTIMRPAVAFVQQVAYTLCYLNNKGQIRKTANAIRKVCKASTTHLGPKYIIHHTLLKFW